MSAWTRSLRWNRGGARLRLGDGGLGGRILEKKRPTRSWRKTPFICLQVPSYAYHRNGGPSMAVGRIVGRVGVDCGGRGEDRGWEMRVGVDCGGGGELNRGRTVRLWTPTLETYIYIYIYIYNRSSEFSIVREVQTKYSCNLIQPSASTQVGCRVRHPPQVWTRQKEMHT
jgi:hypothetical protein